jgi:hypothetical protein
MADLLKYGFIETRKDANWTEYEGHGYRITIFNYMVKTSDNSEINRRTFTVNTKQTSSMAFPLDTLEEWLKNKNINEAK